MRLSKGLISVVLVATVLAGLFLVVKRGFSAEKQTISTIRVAKSTFTKKVSSAGKTVANKSVDLKFQTSGRLAWVGVKEGDTVTAYQALASMDKQEVQKALEKELLDYSIQRNTFEETQRVTYNGHHLPNDVPNDTIKRILEKNQWDLNKAVLDVELGNLAVSYATLISPIGGIITHIDTPVAGVNITPATAVFQVMDPTSIVFRANVDETDVGLVDVGQKAEVTLDAYPNKTFTGKVVSVSYAAQTTGEGGTVFPLDITIDTLKSQRIGFNGDVDITVNELPGQLVIPIDAVREEDAGSFVYKKEGTTYKKITVKIVQTGLDDVVVSGLTVGDEIVVKGFDELPDK